MKLGLFAVYDSIGERIVDFQPAFNSAEYIRMKLPYLVEKYALKDISLYEVGEYETTDADCKVIPYAEKKLCAWTDYKFPSNRAEALSALDVEKITGTKME